MHSLLVVSLILCPLISQLGKCSATALEGLLLGLWLRVGGATHPVSARSMLLFDVVGLLAELAPLGTDHAEVEPAEDLDQVRNYHLKQYGSADGIHENTSNDPPNQNEYIGRDLQRAALHEESSIARGVPIAVQAVEEDVREHEEQAWNR